MQLNGVLRPVSCQRAGKWQFWGDSGESGPFTVRLKMPAGYKISAHTHPHSEPITVIAGEFSFGIGDKLDEKVTKARPWWLR